MNKTNFPSPKLGPVLKIEGVRSSHVTLSPSDTHTHTLEDWIDRLSADVHEHKIYAQ